jgi:hypothetical protein
VRDFDRTRGGEAAKSNVCFCFYRADTDGERHLLCVFSVGLKNYKDVAHALPSYCHFQRKKLWAVGRSFLQGVSEIWRVFWMVFCGEVVVIFVVKLW